VAPRFLDALFVENTERVYHSHIILGGWRVYEGVPPSPLAIPYAKGKQGVVKIEPTGEEQRGEESLPFANTAKGRTPSLHAPQ
jgi:hypothetical protein